MKPEDQGMKIASVNMKFKANFDDWTGCIVSMPEPEPEGVTPDEPDPED